MEIKLLKMYSILLLVFLCTAAYGETVLKIAVVIDAANEKDFEESAVIVNRVADHVFDGPEMKDDPSTEENNGMRIIHEILKALPEQSGQQATTSVRDQNPLRVTSKMVCSEIMNGSSAVVLVHSPSDKSLASAISYALGFYQVPVISTASRDIEFTDKSVHPTFLRMIPSWHQQAEVWVALLEKLNYENVILMYPEESNAVALVAYFHELIDHTSIEIDNSIVYRPGRGASDRRHFAKIESSACNVILLYASADDAYHIFREYTRRFSNSNRSRVFIANELALKANNTPLGLLAVSLRDTNQLRMQMSPRNAAKETSLKESFLTLKKGMKELYQWSIKEDHSVNSPPRCDATSAMSPAKNTLWAETLGPKLYNTLLTTRHWRPKDKALVAFSGDGDRKGAPYVVVNVQSQGWAGEPFRKLVGSIVVGEYVYNEKKDDMILTLNETAIVWGAKATKKPKDFTIKTHLQVGTLADPPFVYLRNVSETRNCSFPSDGILWIPCSQTDPKTGLTRRYCCRGLCMDLLDHLSKISVTPLTYEVRLSSDGQYGAKQSDGGHWTGLVGDLVSGRIDMAVAALSINPERDKAIDFTKPWLYHGVTILEKQRKRSSPMQSFMQPFQWQLWVCILFSVVVIGVIMFGLDKLSPFGRFYSTRPRSDTNEDEYPLGFSGAMWFVWGVLLDSGIGERTPRSLSARVLGMVWCGFSMIMVASYTANLAAFLVLDQPRKSLTGITDIRLRNPNPNYTFATVKNSNVHTFFKSHVEYSTIYRTMEGKNYDTAEQAVADVKNNKLNAFIWDSTYLEHIASSDCGLQTSGELFGKAAYGIGLQKGSHWTQILTLAILQAHESGFMQRLEAKYITGVNPPTCKQDDNAPVRLGLTNMRDLFVLVAGGICLGFIFISFEMFYQRRQASSIRKRQLALHYGRIWRERSSNRRSSPITHCDPFLPHTPSLSAMQPSNNSPMRQQIPSILQRNYSITYSPHGSDHQMINQLLPTASIIWDRLPGPPDSEELIPGTEGSHSYPRASHSFPQESHSPVQESEVVIEPVEYEYRPRQQSSWVSSPSQDEKMAYRPRKAIIV